MKKLLRIVRVASFVGVAFVANLSFAAVRRAGTWPDVDKKITLDLAGVSRSEAVQQIAAAAGWNVVFPSLPDDRIGIHVKNQPPFKVLELVLSDAAYVAERQGDLIRIERDKADQPDASTDAGADAEAASAPPPSASAPNSLPGAGGPKAAPSSGKKGERDRTLFGRKLRVEAGETVNDVSIFGGSADVFGTVEGDLSMMGGTVHLYPTAHVKGDVSALGGSLYIDDDAVVDGDVEVLGGELHRGGRAQIGGEVRALGDHRDRSEHGETPSILSVASRAARAIGWQMVKVALMFVLGAIVIALFTKRMQLLQTELMLRPVRSLALGVASVAVGIVLLVLLCVTVVGIPLAIVGFLLAILAAYGGVCAVLAAVGDALVSRRSNNPYVHLAVGCALLFVASLVPYFGTFAWGLVLLAGLGAFAATGAAGLIRTKGTSGPEPSA